MNASTTPLLVHRRNGTLELQFNRPERANALSPELLLALEAELERAAHDPSLRTVWFTGRGERFFCAGADLDTLFRDPDGLTKILESFLRVVEKIHALPTMVAARINGDCVGGGLGLALACDYLLAASHARFGTPEITKGIFPYVISPTLVERVGSFQARALCFGGTLWSAEQAFQRGLVSEMVISADLDARTEALSNLWENVDPTVLARGKATLKSHSPAPERISTQLVTYLRESVEQARAHQRKMKAKK